MNSFDKFKEIEVKRNLMMFPKLYISEVVKIKPELIILL